MKSKIRKSVDAYGIPTVLTSESRVAVDHHDTLLVIDGSVFVGGGDHGFSPNIKLYRASGDMAFIQLQPSEWRAVLAHLTTIEEHQKALLAERALMKDVPA